jgi:hypothetical protein
MRISEKSMVRRPWLIAVVAIGLSQGSVAAIQANWKEHLLEALRAAIHENRPDDRERPSDLSLVGPLRLTCCRFEERC